MNEIVVMSELSLYILDIAYNSIEASAKNISITINNNLDSIDLIIQDDGLGNGLLNKKTLQENNYSTKQRGYGLRSFIHYINDINGTYKITSSNNNGTVVTASFPKDKLIPLGNIAGSIVTLIQKNQDIDYLFKYYDKNRELILDTKKIKQKLNNVSIITPEVLLWINEYIKEGLLI